MFQVAEIIFKLNQTNPLKHLSMITALQWRSLQTTPLLLLNKSYCPKHTPTEQISKVIFSWTTTCKTKKSFYFKIQLTVRMIKTPEHHIKNPSTQTKNPTKKTQLCHQRQGIILKNYFETIEKPSSTVYIACSLGHYSALHWIISTGLFPILLRRDNSSCKVNMKNELTADYKSLQKFIISCRVNYIRASFGHFPHQFISP